MLSVFQNFGIAYLLIKAKFLGNVKSIDPFISYLFLKTTAGMATILYNKVYNSTCTICVRITSGIPQNSHLGPVFSMNS